MYTTRPNAPMDWSCQDFSRKRHSSDDLVEEQPLSKRMSKLSLNYLNTHRGGFQQKYQQQLHIPQPQQPQFYQQQQQPPQDPSRLQPPTSTPPRRPTPAEERMEVDNVIYISDLDTSSSSDTDDDEQRDKAVVFHPDLARKLNKIPYTLANTTTSSTASPSLPPPQQTSTDLVLYRVPQSITVPEDKDSVRKAIIEARERARMKQANASALVKVVDGVPVLPGGGDDDLMEDEVPAAGWQPLSVTPQVGQVYNDDDDMMEIE